MTTIESANLIDILTTLNAQYGNNATIITNGYDQDLGDHITDLEEDDREFGFASSTFSELNDEGETITVPCHDIMLYSDGYIVDDRWMTVVSSEDYEKLGRGN